VHDLTPLLDLGGVVTFTKYIAASGLCKPSGKQSPWEILIAAITRPYVKNFLEGIPISSGDLLNDQKSTLIHEFLHLYNEDHCGHYPQSGAERDVYEEVVDEATATVMRSHPEIVEGLVEELLLRPNCFIVHEGIRDFKNPFLRYQHHIAGKLVRKVGSEIPVYGDERQLKILRLARGRRR
jgi:hypothetical protein